MKTIKIALFSLLSCGALWAQTGSSSQINGAIRDPTGLAVPGAEVKVTQTATGAVRTVTTGADGSYVLTNLPIGPYQLEVTKDGFTKYVQAGIVLQVDSNPTIDATMKVGAVSEQVLVQADAAMVETHSTGVGQVVDQQRVVDLPLNGRQPTQLIFLSGAATNGQVGNLNGTKNYPTVVISVAGGLSTGLTYLLDGATHNDPYNSLNLPLPFPDALQEFKVETSALPAQYGQHSAAAVNAVTKSGTNEFHGDAFEFLRNGDFNARDFFAAKRDTLKRNQFGGTVGGPIMKNKLFFFGGYQGTIQRSDPGITTGFIATQAMLKGDFSAAASPACNAGRQIPLKAPFSSTDQISPALFSAPAVKLAGLLPVAPDQNCGKIVYGLQNNSQEKLGVGRVDYQLSANHSLFGRYTFADLVQPSTFNSNNYLSTTTAGVSDQVFSAVLGDTFLIGTGTISSFRATLNRSAITKTQVQFFTPRDLGVNMYTPLPGYTFVTVTGAFATGGGSSAPGYVNTTTNQLSEDISLVRGSHQIGFGANWIHAISNTATNLNTNGAFTFSAQNSGLALGDFLLGDVATLTQGNVALADARSDYIGLYVQDAWKVTSRLSLNVGLRWEPFLPVRVPRGRESYFDPSLFAQNVHSSVYPNGPAGTQYSGDQGFPGSAGYFGRNNEFAPRVGMVWDPIGNGRQTIRAAYGIFLDRPYTFYDYAFSNEPPWGTTVSLTNPAGGFANPYQGFTGGNPFPNTLSKNTTFPAAATYISYPLHVKPTYLEQWNFSLQKQIGVNWLFSASYIGNDVVHMWTNNQGNPAVYIPGTCGSAACSTTGNTNQRRVLYLQNQAQGQYYSTLGLLDDGGTGSYNGLLVSAQRRLANNVTVLANYTLSHCISDLVANQFTISAVPYMIPNNRRADRGNCMVSDRRQIVNISLVAQTPKFSNRWAQRLAGGWQLSTIVGALSAQPFNVTTGVDNALTGQSSQRPNLLTADPNSSDQNVLHWINATAFGSPSPGTYGNLGVNRLEGPATLQVDMGISRFFRIRERQNLQVRAEAFNVLNRLNPSTPVATVSSSNFGQITTDINGTQGQTGDPRIIQLALKYVF